MNRASAFAPGRVELLGNHTDYNEGVVLGAAIERGLTVCGSRRDDGRIRLESSSLGTVELEGPPTPPLRESRKADYVLGVAHELTPSMRGFSLEISGDLPAGAGLSSSAALSLATALCLLKLEGREMPPLAIAKACQRAENRYAGVQSGLLDQVTSLFWSRESRRLFRRSERGGADNSFPQRSGPHHRRIRRPAGAGERCLQHPARRNPRRRCRARGERFARRDFRDAE